MSVGRVRVTSQYSQLEILVITEGVLGGGKCGIMCAFQDIRQLGLMRGMSIIYFRKRIRYNTEHHKELLLGGEYLKFKLR